MFCLLDKTSCKDCVCVPKAYFLEKKSDAGWKRWPDDMLRSDPPHVVYDTLQCSIFSVKVKFSWSKTGIKRIRLAEVKRGRRYWGGSISYISYINLGEMCFTQDTFRGEGSMKEWLVLQGCKYKCVTKPLTYHQFVGFSIKVYLSLIPS